jgi:hypothetical protein
MKRLALTATMVLFLAGLCFAQTSTDQTPATKADIERYFQVTKSPDMVKKMVAAMTQNMHQTFHQQFLKHKDELPPDYETKITARMEDLLTNMPMDEMLQAMVPAYQKHFTKGDIDNLIVFYSSPTGEKLLRELPSIMTDSMQDAMPIMMRYMETVQQRLQNETQVMIAQSKSHPKASSPAGKQ